jgi:hypothetical protein
LYHYLSFGCLYRRLPKRSPLELSNPVGVDGEGDEESEDDGEAEMEADIEADNEIDGDTDDERESDGELEIDNAIVYKFIIPLILFVFYGRFHAHFYTSLSHLVALQKSVMERAMVMANQIQRCWAKDY